MRRMDCPGCGVTVEKVPWSQGKSPITKEYGWFLATWAQRMSWSEVAWAFCTTWHTVFHAVETAVAWGREQGVSPATAGEDDVVAYRKFLVRAGYRRPTVALKLAVVRRLYEAATWRGLGQDNSAAGVKAPRGRKSRDERLKFLPLGA